MSLRRTRPVLALAAVGLAVTAVSAHAGPTMPAAVSFTDQSGDGNSLNNQGLASGAADGTPTPIQAAQYDVVKLTIQPTGELKTVKKGKKSVTTFTCTGFTATIDLTGAPSSSASLYRVRATTANNDARFWLQYNTSPTASAPGTIRHGATGEDLTVPLKNAPVVKGNSVTFVVTAADLKAVHDKVGTILENPGVDIRSSAAVTVPQWDALLTPEGTTVKTCG